jgi:hypothetical protein
LLNVLIVNRFSRRGGYVITLVIVAVVLQTAELPAEPASVHEIRSMYAEVMKEIAEGSLLRTEVEINPGDLPYPALGHYRERITLYWKAEAGDRWLLLAASTGEFAAHSEYAEILYTGGPGEEEVAFYYFVSDNLEGPYGEYRTWYINGEIVYGTQCYSRGEEPTYMNEYDDYRGEPDLPGKLLSLFRNL